MNWQQITGGVYLFRDSCNVYAIIGPSGTIIVDAGTGAWLEHMDKLPKPPVALLLTHYFRDHSAGAVAASAAGIPVYVPEYEKGILGDPGQHFRERETYIIYDNLWNLNAPIEGVPVAGVLRDHEKIPLAGLEIETLPLPGVTVSQVGIAFNLNGKNIVCCGETIHSPGKMARVAPLQYNYNDMSGALNVYTSTRWLRERRPDILLPSLGQPILHDADSALHELQESLLNLTSIWPEPASYLTGEYASLAERLKESGPDPLEQVTEHVWKTTHSQSINWFLISKSGKVLAIDYGYDFHNLAFPSYSRPTNRRSSLHSLETLKSKFGIDRIDAVLVSHFHDDHVCGIPLLQRVFGTQCYVPENFADLLEDPPAHCFPCNWPQPIRIDKRLPMDQTFTWEEYTFHFHPMNGHTRFSALIGFEADGKRFAHSGDQYFFAQGWGGQKLKTFSENRRMPNHVYRNGALLDGYSISSKWMMEWRPDIVLQGHQDPFITDEAFFHHIAAWPHEYKNSHQRIMPLGEDETHFNLDSWGGWIWPYRTHLKETGAATVKVTVRNPYPHEAQLEIRLVGPTGWYGTSATLTAAARAEGETELQITPSGPCRRQAFAVELVADGKPFGQVAEGQITVGGEWF